MKKALAVILSCIMLISLFSVFAFAEEAAEFNPYADPDETTARVTYYEAGSEGTENWLNKFTGTDEDSECIGESMVAVNTTAPLKAIVFRYVWAGVPENDQDADLKIEVFTFKTDINTSCSGTPVYSETKHFDGDKVLETHPDLCIYTLPEQLPAGKYVIRASQTGTRGTNEQFGRYVVIPSMKSGYPETHIKFEGIPFGVMLDFVKTEGVTEYLLPLDEISGDFTLDKEEVVSVRDCDSPYSINENHGGEYAILTPVIPEGKVLYTLKITCAPTWENKDGDSNVDVFVYKWKGDYDSSVEGTCLFETRKEGHRDNADLVIEFDAKTLRYGNDNQYLIVIQAYEGKIGYWGVQQTMPEGWSFFGNAGEELEVAAPLKVTYASVGDLGPEPTEAPTEVPTEAPTAAPTEEPAATDEPTEAPTEESKATEAPKATEKAANKDSKKNSNVLPIIILAVCAVVIIACLAVVFAKKKKK